MERPNLDHLEPEVRAYIEYLEMQVTGLNEQDGRQVEAATIPRSIETSEPPTSMQIITISRNAIAKRTSRHLYPRQRRSGMGVFDLDTPAGDPPIVLGHIDENDDMLLFTNLARTFRLPVSQITSTEVRSKGKALQAEISLARDEHIVAALPAKTEGYVSLVSAGGFIRSLRYHLFGENMMPGTAMVKVEQYGPLAAGCWLSGEDDVFITTQNGMAIRFSHKLIPTRGVLGINLVNGDEVVAVTGVNGGSGVFLLGADGKGTVRLMSGFAPNKSPGGIGKFAMKSEELVAAFTVFSEDEIFIITQLSKIIRFQADEIPAKTGVVQGVHCIALRADHAVTAVWA